MPVRRACQAQGYPPAHLSRLFDLTPVDALIGIKVRCGLRCQIPVWLGLHTLAHLRITTVFPQQ